MLPRAIAAFTILGPLLSTALLAPASAAQRGAEGPRVRRLEPPQANLVAAPSTVASASGQRPRILLTGYWPPTNEAIRRFSPSPVQNPTGWIGQDWEGRGYDVYAFFPEFVPPDCSACGQGNGDLEVDYQDTSQDFWAIANAIRPIAVLTTSRGGIGWEVEMNQYNRALWVDDFTAPTQPTPKPPDASLPAGALRPSTLPVQEIVDDVREANLPVQAFICFSGDGGGYLSEFIAYHGVWYQDLHASPSDPARCVAAGHVHVNHLLSPALARAAAEVTLRTLIRHVDRVLDPQCHSIDLHCETEPNSAGVGASLTTTGSASIAAGDLVLRMHGAPPGAAARIFYGQGRLDVPFGGIRLCIAPPIALLGPFAPVGADGRLAFAVDVQQPPLSGAGIVPGSGWHFQGYYRDPAPSTDLRNASNAVRVTFCP
jgi:pyrrolidone-carboxylate peptidase